MLGCHKENWYLFSRHYIDPESTEITYGSSFLVEEIAHDINSKRMSKNFICACETDRSHHDNFKKVIADIGRKTISLKNDDFQNVLDEPRVKRYYSNHPTLFFVDPFGYTMKISSIAKMMVNRKNEVLINFMFDFINRFLSVTEPNTLDDFFGSKDWRNATSTNLAEREKYLVDLFKQNVKKQPMRNMYTHIGCVMQIKIKHITTLFMQPTIFRASHT